MWYYCYEISCLLDNSYSSVVHECNWPDSGDREREEIRPALVLLIVPLRLAVSRIPFVLVVQSYLEFAFVFWFVPFIPLYFHFIVLKIKRIGVLCLLRNHLQLFILHQIDVIEQLFEVDFHVKNFLFFQENQVRAMLLRIRVAVN